MTTPAGWYPDISGGTRYWDGQQWTAAAAPAPPAERRFTIHYGFALLAGLSILGTLLIGIPMLASAIGTDDPGTQSVGMGMTVMWFMWGGLWILVWSAFAINHTLKSRR